MVATRLRVEERAEHLWPVSFEVAVSLESALQHILDSLLRFRPSQCGLKRGDGVEEPVGGRQRDLVDEILRGSNGTSVEGGDPARERVDEAVQLGVRKCPVDVAVSLRGVAIRRSLKYCEMQGYWIASELDLRIVQIDGLPYRQRPGTGRRRRHRWERR